MDIFRWDRHYQTGIATVDAQHQRLVEILNRFIELMTRKETASLPQILAVHGELLAYAQAHFHDEEAMMAQEGIDPRHLNRHHALHQSYIREITREKKNIEKNPATALALLDFLGHWLIHHILGTDQSMARQLAAIHAGVTAAQAYSEERKTRQKSMEPLLQALNRMVEQVMERNDQLAQANETLEARVAERTAQLGETVKQLEEEMAESRRLGEELARANAHLQEIALTDVLTGLPNRRAVLTQLDRLWSESQRHGVPLACIMIDADGFKQVNDQYGHDAGDVVLQAVAAMLRESVRHEDIVSRLGGDEFLILCPQTDQAGALSLAEHLRNKARALHVRAADGEWQGSLSLGVAARESRYKNSEEMLKVADEGLYVAKRSGRNRVGVAA